MKKMFLAAITALALCSYGYAQDEYEDEYDEAPAKVEKKAKYVEEDEDEAPVAKKAEKKAKKSSDGAFMGIGIDVAGALAGETTLQLAFRLNDRMVLSALLGFWHHGESSYTPNGGTEMKGKDNYTELAIGAGFDFFVMQNFLPVSIGGEFIYVAPHSITAAGETYVSSADIDLMNLKINVLLGAQAELVQNLTLNGKVGLGFDYFSESDPAGEGSFLDMGLVTKVYLTWYMF